MHTLKELAAQRSYRVTEYRVKGNIGNDAEENDLPPQIDDLIDNKNFRNKYRKMIRDGHLKQLLRLSEIAHDKDNPSHWFAKMCKKSLWENTIEWLKKLDRVARQARQIADRLGVGNEQMHVIYKACWMRSDALLQAIKAEEIGKVPFKLFNWLIWRGSGQAA